MSLKLYKIFSSCFVFCRRLFCRRLQSGRTRMDLPLPHGFV